mmetsp:Transcript_16529/g.30561  ORF Transcript_16529/g.30561 Transcript_16529/m.30561 type:complete len:487 (-) Transcript_16529:75-1535(-)
MIQYQSEKCNLFFILRCHGSVFPFSLLVALPCAIICAVLKYLQKQAAIEWFLKKDSVLSDSAAYSGFSFLVGFIVVFRTNQAYSRFWEGVTSTCRMRAEWFDAASSLVAFCKAAKADEEAVLVFQHTLVRLFSMLHSAAVEEIQGSCAGKNGEGLELIDAKGIDVASLCAVRDSDCKVGLVFQWIQQLIVENIGTGVLTIAPPILSRSFQEFATGMVNFHDAVKISIVPFPFPYAQTTEALLLLHWALSPLVICMWVDEWVWAGVFCFIQVFILWSLNAIATEIEDPFGEDQNDLDGAEMQQEFNQHLLLLLQPTTKRTPHLSSSAVLNHEVLEDPHQKGSRDSFLAVWDGLPELDEADQAWKEVDEASLNGTEAVPLPPVSSVAGAENHRTSATDPAHPGQEQGNSPPGKGATSSALPSNAPTTATTVSDVELQVAGRSLTSPRADSDDVQGEANSDTELARDDSGPGRSDTKHSEWLEESNGSY